MNSIDVLEIDGAQGEGGGQILRTSMGLSALSGQPIRIHSIRAKRKHPGLRNQHLCAVRAASEICQGQLFNAELGSSELIFYPGELQTRNFRFQIGSAGSCSLVAQTVLLPLLNAESPEPITIGIEGGTHNPLAPPFEFLAHAYLPLLQRMGFAVDAKLMRHGFYPNGGGRIEFTLAGTNDAKLRPLKLLEPGRLKQIEASAWVANLPAHIAQRELDTLRRRSQWHRARYELRELDDPSLGMANLLLVRLEHENSCEVISSFGKQGVRAEQVATRAWKSAQLYQQLGAPVGEYLCDQLLLPAALVAARTNQTSQFVTGPLSLHAETHIDLLQRLLPVEIRTTAAGKLIQLDIAADPDRLPQAG